MNRDDGISGQAGRECERMRRLLSERLDRALETDETLRLTEHLAGCPGCARFERRLGRGMHTVAALPGATADPAVRAAVLHRAAGSRRRALAEQGLKLAGAVAAFGLIGLLLVTVLRPGGGDDGADGLRSGSGVEATPTLESVPTEMPTPQPAATACASSLISTVAQAMTISSTPNGAIIWFGVQGSPNACVVQPTVAVTLTDRDGTPLEIEGNGQSVELVTGVEDRPPMAGVLWLNWCGATTAPIVLWIDFGSSALPVDVAGTPGCDDPNQPSKLGVVPPNEIAPDWPEAGEPGVTPVCRGGEYTWNAETLASDGTRLITLKVTPDGEPCMLYETFTIELRDAAQQPLDIAGNFLTVEIDNVIPLPGGSINLQWTNWCGNADGIELVAEGNASGFGLGPIDSPECTDPALPSELRLIANPDPTVPEATEALPVCPSDAYVFMLSTEGAAGTRYLLVSIIAVEKTECAISEKFTVQIVDANGIPLDINGNGVTTELNVPLGGLADTWLAWSNWCGDAGAYRVVVDASGGSSDLEIESPPCVNPDQPSELLLGDHRFR